MIALSGLTLVTGRIDVAKSLLLAFRYVDRGILPNHSNFAARMRGDEPPIVSVSRRI
jgi:glycogen debranching enzyme